MKKLLALSLLLLLAAPLLGQDDSTESSSPEILENADMSDGTTHWHGDAKIAGADTSTDLITGQSGRKGIAVDLHPATWSKITQVLHGLKIVPLKHGFTMPTLQLTIVYQISPDFSLSAKDTDYADIGSTLGFEKVRINGHLGQIMAFIDYPVAAQLTNGGYTQIERISASFINPKTDQQPQTFTATLNFPNGNTYNDITFCLAFPPGTGSVTLTKISLIDVSPKPAQ